VIGTGQPVVNRSLSHANRFSGRAFAADPETDFERSETKGPNPLPDGLRFPKRPRTGHYTRPKLRENRGCSAETGNSGLAQDCVVGPGRTRTANQTVMSGRLSLFRMECRRPFAISSLTQLVGWMPVGY
jgi:hypothetical protein